ncbi:MAG: metallophosphoesterase, partial [Lachnospiraceae bacterium]|nr:metallophosphoesterase [Lachnospiraceae bacterium]
MTLLWIGIVIAAFAVTVAALVLLRQIPETMLRMFGMSAFSVGLVLTIIFTVKHPMNLAVILLHMTVFVLVAIVADGILTAGERRKRVAAGLPAYVATEESSAYGVAGLPGWTPATRGRVCRIAAASVGCALYLAAGLFSANHIVRTEITVTTDKNIPVGQNGTSYCIVQLSDVHLGTTVDLKDWERLLARVANEKPDMVVITGDFTDSSTSREDMVRACEAFDRLPRECAIYYVPGNHDSEEGKFTPGELQENLQKHSVRTLQDEFAYPALNISVLGRKDRSVSRSSMGEFW